MTHERIDWSETEVAETVRSYMDMLTLEVSGEPYKKRDFRRALLPKLSGRTEAAIEFKHQNISAVLMELGLRPIKGYRPARNYQHSLVPEVQRQLRSCPSIVELVLAEAIRGPKGLNPSGMLNLVSASTPSITLPKIPDGVRAQTRPVDYAAIEARNRNLGLAGECAVIDLEIRRLVLAGKPNLAQRIEHVSQTRGDWVGYDILSFEDNGKEKLIEVKTTRSRVETPFFVTNNELQVSRERRDAYHLVRIFNFELDPGWYALQGSLDSSCVLETNGFTALPRLV